MHIDSERYIEQEFRKINRFAENGRVLNALEKCEALFQRYPDHPRVLQGFGMLHYRNGEWEAGENYLKKALHIAPGFVDCHYNLGLMLHDGLRIEEAEAEYRTALQLAPENYKVLSALASLLIKKSLFREALECCQKALAINPDYVHTYGNLASIYFATGKMDQAIELYKKAISIAPVDKIHSTLLFAMNTSSMITQKQMYDEALDWNKRYIPHNTAVQRGYLNCLGTGKKLRVGYVSGDFRIHPVGYHLKPLLAAHHKDVVEVYLYNTFPFTDNITKEFSELADFYRDISELTDSKVESLIRHDGIDILVDLSGHTAFHRLYLFARRPAPIQLTWLGYFNTTGLSAIDYLISDPVTIPVEEDCYFSEKIIRLPNCRFCYAPPDYSPEVSLLPAIENKYITFGSFNAIHKLSPEILSLWARVLVEIPFSKMVIKSKAFREREILEDVIGRFADHGISADRLVLRPPSTHAEMLNEYSEIDIALDTFPFTGGVTTCEALWMGVPVITLEGNTPISRQSKSFLMTIGCPDLIASSEDNFVKIARILAADIISLSDLRSSLRQKMADSSLCDGNKFACDLEQIYRNVWTQWCEDNAAKGPELHNSKNFSVDELYNAGLKSLADDAPNHAEVLFRLVLKRRPKDAAAANNLGVALKKTGNISGAIRAFQRAIRIDPSCEDLYLNLGRTFLDNALFEKARKVLSKGVMISPQNLELLNNLGVANRLMSRYSESIKMFERVLESDGNNVEALGQMALLFGSGGYIDKSIEYLKHALNIEPDNEELLSSLVALMQYSNDVTQEVINSLAVKIGSLLNKNDICYEISRLLPGKNVCHLKIGFVSADFIYHPVGMLLVSLFKGYNTERLSFYCYNNGVKRDDLTNWYQMNSAVWRDIHGVEDDKVAKWIIDDGIDILIDLSGHTSMHRLSLFSKRPAPVQATWMGYGHTTGLSQMDYIIADSDFIKPQEQKWFTEQAVYLPYNRFCFTPPLPYPEVVEQLPVEENGYITFGSFNNLAKYSREVIETWADLLKKVPKSKLILKYKAFNDKAIRNHVRMQFASHGIPANRIEFRTASRLYIMMAEFCDIDISLDPFPFTGGMTSLFSLWMGVPIVTLAGDIPISRQTKSFLELVELGELVAHNSSEYVSLAASLANNHGKLKQLRKELRLRMFNSPLCDAAEYSKAMEELLFKMWREKIEENAVRHIL